MIQTLYEQDEEQSNARFLDNLHVFAQFDGLECIHILKGTNCAPLLRGNLSSGVSQE